METALAPFWWYIFNLIENFIPKTNNIYTNTEEWKKKPAFIRLNCMKFSFPKWDHPVFLLMSHADSAVVKMEVFCSHPGSHQFRLPWISGENYMEQTGSLLKEETGSKKGNLVSRNRYNFFAFAHCHRSWKMLFLGSLFLGEFPWYPQSIKDSLMVAVNWYIKQDVDFDRRTNAKA